MGWTIAWTEAALQDLGELVRFIAADNKEVAVRIGDEIVDHVEILKTFPKSGLFIADAKPRMYGRSHADLFAYFTGYDGRSGLSKCCTFGMARGKNLTICKRIHAEVSF